MNKSSIFNIKNSKVIFPPRAMVDTNVFLDIYLSRKHKNDWVSFFGKGASQGSEFVYTTHTIRELRNVLNYQIHDKKAKELSIERNRNTPAWKVLENNPKYNFGKTVTEEVIKVQELLDNAGFMFKTITNEMEIIELENLYSSNYDLGPGDAAIAATMEQLEISSICTNDAGFFKTDNFNVYSPTDKAIRVSKNRSSYLKDFKSIK